jgi:hypothetical protein
MIRPASVMRLGLLIACLSGCAATPAPDRADQYWLRPDVQQPSGEAASLLYYLDYLRGLPAAQQETEKARQRQAWVEDKSVFRRLQYAMTLSGPTASTAERRTALQLLESIARDPRDQDPELHLLAELLYRVEESERKLEAMKGIEHRLGAMKETEQRRLEAIKELERKVEASKELERKLEAMKEIERNLLQRDRGEGSGSKKP